MTSFAAEPNDLQTEGGAASWWNPRSMRSQLILWNALTLVLLFSVLAIVLRYALQAILMSSIDRELMARTDQVVFRNWTPPAAVDRQMAGQRPGQNGAPAPGENPFLPRGNGPLGPPDRPGGRDQMKGDPAGSAAWRPPAGVPPGADPARDYRDGAFRPRIMDPRGRILDPPDEARPWDSLSLGAAIRGEPVFSTIFENGEWVRVLSRRFPAHGSPLGVIQAPYPLNDVYRTVGAVNVALLLLLPLALIGAGVGSALLTNRALVPVRRLSRAAGQIGAADLSRRLPVRGDDEFGELASTFNGMLGRIELSFREQESLVGRLRQLVEQQRRFTADASHELRTPLTTIRANTSLCLSGETTMRDMKQSICDIDRAAAEMTRLVDDLLLLARSDAGRLGQNRIDLPIREAAERAAAVLAGKHPDAAKIEIQIEDPALTVHANEAEVVRLLTNLLDNAARHTPTMGQIAVQARRAAEVVQINVTDSGCGIAPEHVPHLGERFYRADASRSRPEGGTGLGLSICKSIVEAHGGVFDIRSVVGKGTRVTFTLPAAG